MIVMDVQIDNFLAFRNFHMNMSYPKKIVGSYIQDEHLFGYPNFRYKKVNILMGANASGKTSFGRVLMKIFNFIDKKQTEVIEEIVSDSSKEAEFRMDFITDTDVLYRILIKVPPQTDKSKKDRNIDVCVKKVSIKRTDSYESCARRFDNVKEKQKSNYIEELDKIEGLSWLFEYPSDQWDKYYVPERNIDKYLHILENTLRALDPAIEKVEQIQGVENAFVLRMTHRDIIMQDGEIINANVLSSGTRAGIAVANFVTAIMNGDYGFYYCDEKFSYIHSDIEKAFLSVMIECMQSNDQLFFTTHNTDILDLPLPKHSFTFLKKECDDRDQPIKCISASQYLKRNTDSLRTAVDNDLFSSAPAVDLIYEIAELE